MSGESRLKRFAHKAWKSWATRSLAVGGVATVIDVAFGTFMVSVLLAPSAEAAMSGALLGSVFTFFANRYFAFREKNPKLATPAVRFAIVNGVSIFLHGLLVAWLRDKLGVPFVPAKLASDVVVFSVFQLLLLRYVVFRKSPEATEPEAAAAPPPPSEGSPAPR